MNCSPRIFFLFFILCAFSIGLPQSGYAQVQSDLSQVKVDELSDAQIKKFIQQVEATGMTEGQLEQVASARGMKSGEIVKLRKRVNEINQKKTGTAAASTKRTGSEYPQGIGINPADSTSSSASLTKILDGLKTPIFGHELFYNAQPQFTPNLQIATPDSYVVGPQDHLLINIYGSAQASYDLTVSRDGKINIPNAGVIAVSGMSIAQIKDRIRARLSTIYPDISSGRTQVDIGLGEIRSVQVILGGEVKQPGTYTLPSVATVFNALYAAGGPTEKGSLRNIKVFRSGELISVLDVYQFLINGSLEGNITLHDQDVILISTSEHRVYVGGEVNRPMYFDGAEGDTFSDLVKYAGGFTDKAYTARVSVERLTKRERKIEDLLDTQFDHFELKRGDRFTVDSILDRFENRVQIEGAVFNPGTYELTPGLSLSILIKKADGVTEDAFLNLGYINRQKENLENERINFNVAEIMAGTQQDIQLRKEDVVHISSIFDLKNEYTVRIEGEVRNPGTYSYYEGETVKDLILEAGGFKESASTTRIEVSRRVFDANPLDNSSKTANILYMDLERDLSGPKESTVLQPYDFITVRSRTGYEAQKNIRIEGEVLYPGIYTIQSKNERISDIIERAGGLTAYAYAKGGSLKRAGIRAKEEVKSSETLSESEKFAEEQQKIKNEERLEQLEELTDEKINVPETEKKQNDYVGVQIDRILKDPDYSDNILVEDGDVIFIPKRLQTVRISGEVLSPVNTVYKENVGFKEYISQAGGFSQDAMKRRAYIVYANGSAKSTKNFLGIKSYPKVEAGAEIYVPRKPERAKMSPQAWVGIGSSFASLVAIIVSIFR